MLRDLDLEASARMTDLELAVWHLMSTDDYEVVSRTAESATLICVHNEPPHPRIVITVEEPG